MPYASLTPPGAGSMTDYQTNPYYVAQNPPPPNPRSTAPAVPAPVIDPDVQALLDGINGNNPPVEGAPYWDYSNGYYMVWDEIGGPNQRGGYVQKGYDPNKDGRLGTPKSNTGPVYTTYETDNQGRTYQVVKDGQGTLISRTELQPKTGTTEPEAFSTSITSDPDGFDYRITKDKNGNVLSKEVIGRTATATANPVTWKTVSEGGRDYSYGYDKDGNVVSRDYLGETQGAGTTDTSVNTAGLYKTYSEALAAAPAGFEPTQLTNGYWVLDKSKTSTTDTGTNPAGLYETYAAAVAAAPPGYEPAQLTNGWWVLDKVSGGTTDTSVNTAGLYKTYAEAAAAAPAGYVPTQLTNGYWVLDNQGTSTGPIAPPTGSTGGYTDAAGQIYSWDNNTGKFIVTGYDPTKDTSGAMSDYQKIQVAMQQASAARSSIGSGGGGGGGGSSASAAAKKAEDAAKQQRLIELAAHPINWLQYAAEAEKPAVIQPWMLPLQPGQYGLPRGQFEPVNQVSITQPEPHGNWRMQEREKNNPPHTSPNTTPWEIGGKIPGFSATNMSNMPGLLNPSAQYYSRLTPSMQEQYMGYQQAQTGATPEDTAWLLQQSAPQSGQWPGLRYTQGY